MALADRFARRGQQDAVDPPPASVPAPRQAVGDQLKELLDRAGAQDADAGREEWLAKAVAQLVPDEARILQLLAEYAEGDPGCALVHIHCLTGTGIPAEALLENASLAGRAAHVALPELTPWYLTRLLQLDLVEVVPEDPRLHDDYQQLLGDSTVLAALGRARQDGFTPRVLRHCVRLAPLGRALWSTVSA